MVVNLDLGTLANISQIIAVIIAIVVVAWGVWKYSQKQFRKGYLEGKRDGQRAVEEAHFLIKDDELIVGSDVMRRGNELLEEAKNYIKIITVTGAAWMLGKTKKIIEKKVKKGVLVQLILVDAQQIGEYISEMESKFTAVPRPAERVFGKSVEMNVSKIIEIYSDVIGSKNIRLYANPFFWKGSIVDGRKAMYTMFDVPRHDTPLRVTANELVAKHFEKYYFDEIWNQSITI